MTLPRTVSIPSTRPSRTIRYLAAIRFLNSTRLHSRHAHAVDTPLHSRHAHAVDTPPALSTRPHPGHASLPGRNISPLQRRHLLLPDDVGLRSHVPVISGVAVYVLEPCTARLDTRVVDVLYPSDTTLDAVSISAVIVYNGCYLPYRRVIYPIDASFTLSTRHLHYRCIIYHRNALFTIATQYLMYYTQAPLHSMG